jgi:hypothetical protein
MPIPEYQLETWSHQGAIESSKRTHKAVRRALRQWDDLRNRDYEVYLQGSYRNSTNIRGSSDVDVIAQMNDTFRSNKLELPPDQREAHDRAYDPGKHTLERFRGAVLAALRAHFGRPLVVEGNKAIKILPASGRLPADVVVCQQYRRYDYFYSRENHAKAEGMRFRTRDGREIINFPKRHYVNGVRKNDQCAVSYKAGVRVFKNARNAIVNRGWMPPSVPSYFLECFAYNATSDCYSGTWQSLYYDVLMDLTQDARYPKYLCQNGVRPLFGSSYDQWDISSATQFVNALWRLWSEWS